MEQARQEILRGLIAKTPHLETRFPQLSEHLHRARLGMPHPTIRQMLGDMGFAHLVGTARKRMSEGLQELRPGVNLAYIPADQEQTYPSALTDARGAMLARSGIVKTVHPYPVAPENAREEVAAVLEGGETIRWGQPIAIVTPDAALRWEEAMEHETDTGLLPP